MKTQLLLLAAFITLTACSPQRGDLNSPAVTEAALIGGQPVQAGSEIAKSVVILRNKSTLLPLCTGALIKANMVLTAAHCVFVLGKDGKSLTERKDFEIVFSTTANAKDQSRVREARLILAHPEVDKLRISCLFRKTDKDCLDASTLTMAKRPTPNDLAIVVLKNNAPEDTVALKVIQSPRLDRRLDLVFVGAGVRSLSDLSTPEFLRENAGRVDFVNKLQSLGNSGSNIAGDAYQAENGELLVNYQSNVIIRPGDSGAPLLIKTSDGLQILGVVRGGEQQKLDPRGGTKKLYLSYYNYLMNSRFWVDPIVNSNKYD